MSKTIIEVPGANSFNQYVDIQHELNLQIPVGERDKFEIISTGKLLLDKSYIHFGHFVILDECKQNVILCGTDIDTIEIFPNIVRGHLGISSNQIRSLVGVHNHLKYCPQIDLSNNDIMEGGIGLLLVEGLFKIINHGKIHALNKAMQIINNYLILGQAGLLECQQELIEEGLDQYAKL